MSKSDFVQEFILKKISTGEYTSGMRLPSCRQLASELAVNKITVNKAYEALEIRHYLYSIPRGGYYVVEGKVDERERKAPIDFSLVRPEENLIPFRRFSHCMNNAIELYKERLFLENPPEGLLELRKILEERFKRDGVYGSAENILITHGGQQGIDLIFQVLFQVSDKKILLEVPTYSLAIKRAEQLNISIDVIERSEKGINLKTLESKFKTGEIGAFYCISRYHNPTGFSLPEEQKKKIAYLAGKYDVWIIEDDYLGDLGHSSDGRPIHYYDTENKVVYIRSFSKTFMPSIRIGALLCPDMLRHELIQLKRTVDLSTSALPQSSLALFFSSGLYDKHLKKIKKIYEKKLRTSSYLLTSLDTHNLKWYVPKSGIFIWLEWNGETNISKVIPLLAEMGIKIVSSHACYYGTKDHNTLRLCISSVKEENLLAIDKIIKSLK